MQTAEASSIPRMWCVGLTHRSWTHVCLPYFPEYKLHFLSRNTLGIFDVRLSIERVNFTHARTRAWRVVVYGRDRCDEAKQQSYTAAFKLKVPVEKGLCGKRCGGCVSKLIVQVRV